MSSLFYLNKYLLKYKWYLIFGIICIAVSNRFYLYMPKIAGDSIDEIITYIKDNQSGSHTETILNLALMSCGLYIGFALLKGFFLFLTRQTIIKMSRFIEFDLKNEIYHQYQNLSFSFYKENSTGDLMNRISEDVSKVRMYLGPGLMYTINLVILSGMVIYQMVLISPELTLYALIPLPIMSIIIYFVSSLINKKSTILQQQQSDLTTVVHESFSGIRIIKSHIKEDLFRQKFDDQSESFKTKSIALTKVNAIFMPIVILLIGTSSTITIYSIKKG